MTKVLTDNLFEQETASGLVLVDFWAPWCGPCRMQSPVIDTLSEKLDGVVDFYKMNVDEESQTAQKFGIMSIPTLLLFKDGEVVEKLVGYHDKERLSEILHQYL